MARPGLAALALALGACFTTPDGGVNLHKVQAYAVAAEDTLQGLVVSYGETDPDFAFELQRVTSAVGLVRARVDQAVASDVGTIDIVQSIDLALVAVAALASVVIDDPEKRARITGTATVLAGLLRLLRIEFVQ